MALPYETVTYTTSDELCAEMAEECDTAILAFSTGKDSIAAWLQMRKYFKRIIPYYCYFVPGIHFVEDSLKYYEDFFGCHIYRLPHRSFYRMLNQYIYQSPEHARIIMQCILPSDSEYNDDTIGDIIRHCGKLPESAYVGVGLRMADSPMRRVGLKTHGCINHNAKRFYPIYDWKKEDIIRAIDEAGIKLPVDYRLFGRSFDGLDYRFIAPIREQLPDDYKIIEKWYPFIDIQYAMRCGDFNSVMKERRRIHEQVEGYEKR